MKRDQERRSRSLRAIAKTAFEKLRDFSIGGASGPIPGAMGWAVVLSLIPIIAWAAPGGYAKEYWNETNLSDPGIFAMVSMTFLIFVVPRGHAALPLLMVTSFVAVSQRVAIFTLDFHLLRLMILAGWVRLLVRRETKRIDWTKIDTAIILWAASATFFFTIRKATFGALVNRLGLTFDALGIFFFFRQTVRSWSDLDRVMMYAALLSIPVSGVFLYEYTTGYNLFSVFGGLLEWTQIRQGRLRCQGPFPHAIMAGCFWATLLPLVFVRFFRRSPGAKVLAVVGSTCIVLIVFTTASSTPLLAVIGAIGAGCLYPFRHYLRHIRWSVVGFLFIVHFSGNKPAWHLIARLNVVGGSTGYYRYRLIDAFVKKWKSWVVMGVNSTAGWGRRLTDITNQFILEGVRGGLVTLIFFIHLLYRCYQGIGQGLRLRERRGPRWQHYYTWAVGASLFTHCVIFFATSYFGQIKLVWFLTLACAAIVTPAQQPARSKGRRKGGRKRAAPSRPRRASRPPTTQPAPS